MKTRFQPELSSYPLRLLGVCPRAGGTGDQLMATRFPVIAHASATQGMQFKFKVRGEGQ